jgi:hypothetical protein
MRVSNHPKPQIPGLQPARDTLSVATVAERGADRKRFGAHGV